MHYEDVRYRRPWPAKGSHPSCNLCRGTGLTRRADIHETRPCDCAEAWVVEADLKAWASAFQPSRRYEKRRKP